MSVLMCSRKWDDQPKICRRGTRRDHGSIYRIEAPMREILALDCRTLFCAPISSVYLMSSVTLRHVWIDSRTHPSECESRLGDSSTLTLSARDEYEMKAQARNSEAPQTQSLCCRQHTERDRCNACLRGCWKPIACITRLLQKSIYMPLR